MARFRRTRERTRTAAQAVTTLSAAAARQLRENARVARRQALVTFPLVVGVLLV